MKKKDFFYLYNKLSLDLAIHKNYILRYFAQFISLIVFCIIFQFPNNMATLNAALVTFSAKQLNYAQFVDNSCLN